MILVAGVGAALWVSFRWLSASGLAKPLVLTGFAVLFFTWAGGAAWSSRHKFPLFGEALAYRANVHHDPLFNSAVANMMQSYGVPSTGIDGIPYVPYHYGAAWLHSQWADLAGTVVLTFYNIGPTVVMIPVFACALLLLVVEVRSALRRRRRPPPALLELDYLAGGALLAGTIGVIPSAGLDAMGVWNRHVLISESYTTGLPVFLFVAALLLVFHDSGALGGATAVVVRAARAARAAPAPCGTRLPQGVADDPHARCSPLDRAACGAVAAASRPRGERGLGDHGARHLQARVASIAERGTGAARLHALQRARRVVAVFSPGSSVLVLGVRRRPGAGGGGTHGWRAVRPREGAAAARRRARGSGGAGGVHSPGRSFRFTAARPFTSRTCSGGSRFRW